LSVQDDSKTASDESLETTRHQARDPERRCVACRRRESRAALLRFVWTPERELLFDLRKKAPGRGMHVCAKQSCIEQALRAAFRRAPLAGRVPEAQTLISDTILPALWRRYGEMLSNARRSQALVMGSEKVERLAVSGQVVAYLLASDASAGTRSKIEGSAARKGLPVTGLWPRERLSAAIGKENAVVSAWLDRTQFEAFERLEQQIRELDTRLDLEPQDRTARGKGL
jgi:predicted RNA-binding protein YlxR (DUF448 family)/ribosomal protein L7Ae-like RNA K-turn-binding protein